MANATSTTIRTEARAWELEEELGNLRVRMAVMAADTSRVASNARDTCAALSSSSTAITQVSARTATARRQTAFAQPKHSNCSVMSRR